MTIEEIAKRLVGKKKVILTHGNSDMDAIGSAFAIRCAFGPADIFAPAGVDRVAKMVAEKLDIPILDYTDLSDYELVVVVDTSSPEQLQNEAVIVPANSVVIDHHAPTGKWVDMDYFCDETRTSCCEIVKDMIDLMDIPLSKAAGLALIGGMLTDSGHFQYADPRMLRAFADVMERCSIPMDEAMMLTRAPVNMNERNAAMKAIGRSKFERVGDMIVAVSFGSSFEAASCRALMASGADVVFVGSQRENEFRVSARATQEMVRRGIKLDAILGELSKETFTDGGGHGGAAGMTGTGDVEAMVHMCMSKTMDEFRRIKATMEAQGLR
ncbi:MAG: DHH family phosphoesterase [archaeon]|nr:DHH family phosphoesterase [archaeon]